MKVNHNKTEINMVCRRIFPVNILKLRDNEALCKLKNNNEEETLEWIDIEDLSIDTLDESNFKEDSECKDSWPVITDIDDWISSPWESIK